jgi:Anti-sigma-K factor rskA, C-terminal
VSEFVSEFGRHHLVDDGTRFDSGDDPGAEKLVELLDAEATWLEPGPSLEIAVVRAVDVARARRRNARRLVRRVAVGATAIAAACALVFGLTARHEAHVEFRGTLTASGSLPRVTGSAEVYRSPSGFRVALDAAGLPDLPAGRYYEAWLSDDDGREVPVGTFSSGRGEITLWSGRASTRFSRMTVTLESGDNDQAPSGDVVLAGELHRL